MSTLLTFYRALTGISGPALKIYLNKRLQRGKEDPQRLRERFGEASLPRPSGKLLWIHSASNGEILSILPMVPILLAKKPDWNILMTAGTRSARDSFDKQAANFPPGRVIHQFIPVDHPSWVHKFMNHWHPDAVIWMESELWPNLLHAIRKRNLPAVLLNARMRPNTVKRWRSLTSAVREMLSTFCTVFVMAKNFAPIYQEFGARQIEYFGNLKIDKPPLAVDTAALQELKTMIGNRPCISAIATHPTDEALFAETYQKLKAEHPTLLGLIALKHPSRGEDVRAELATMGLNVSLRSTGDAITPETAIYIADTFGEMGLWYNLAPFGLIGGSVFPFGGQNPYEGIHFGFVAIYGPYMFNFPDTTAILEENDISVLIDDKSKLYEAMKYLLDHPDVLSRKQETAKRVATESTHIIEPTADYIVQHIMTT